MNRPEVVDVKRDGKLMMMQTFDLVVGDIIEIRAGEATPADCLVLNH